MKVNKDKYIGCIQGGAIGDALGAPIEFLSLAEIRDCYGKEGVQDYVEYKGPRGAFTDDTQMTLFTAEALLRGEFAKIVRGIEGILNSLAHQSYLRWLHTQDIPVEKTLESEGKFDIKKGWLVKQKELHKVRGPGHTVVSALSSGKAGTIKEPINDSKGCGTVMRIAPVGLIYHNNPRKAFSVGCDFSAITHGHPTGYLSAGFLAAMIAYMASKEPIRTAIDKALGILNEWEMCQETVQAIEGALALYKTIKESKREPSAETIEKLGAGWIAEEALAMSLLASLVYENDFRKGVLFAVNHSGDSDSTGSITGNILGLNNGLKQIPIKWIRKLIAQNIVKEMGEDIHQKIVNTKDKNHKQWESKYGE